jgi:hypothetical protein
VLLICLLKTMAGYRKRIKVVVLPLAANTTRRTSNGSGSSRIGRTSRLLSSKLGMLGMLGERTLPRKH